MNIRIVNYTPSASPVVQAFVAIEIDGWLRFNGLSLFRDGTLLSAQLTPMRNGKRLFFDAVQILDAELAQLLAADILAAIHAHIALRPPERRLRPPVVSKPRSKPNLSTAAQGDLSRMTKVLGDSASLAKSPKPAAAPPPKADQSPTTPKLKLLPPPQRLLAPGRLRSLAGGAK